MIETYYKNVSHVDTEKMHETDDVRLIPKGTKYSSIFYNVEPTVFDRDKTNSIFGSELRPIYKAADDRYEYKYNVGTAGFIEENSKQQLAFVNGIWYRKPHATIHFIDKTQKVVYFSNDNELQSFMQANFKNFKTLDSHQKIRIQ